MSARPASRDRCHVLLEDPDLAEAVPGQLRERAINELTAPELVLPAGPWSAEQAPAPNGGIGLLVLGGLMVRRVGVEGRCGAELIGECDVLRPGPGGDSLSATLNTTTGWSVIEPTRLAVLDADFAARLVVYPQLVGRLVGRAVQRSRHLTVYMAIIHQARVDVRLHVLFWHLAGRWGRVRSDGTLLPLRLTHVVLSDLVAARRPTVTTALSKLSRRGLVTFTDEGWLLAGEPPGELIGIGAGEHRG